MSIFTLTGPNDFLVDAHVKETKIKFSDKYGDFAVEKIDGEEADINRITEALQNLPFLAEGRLVILRNPSVNKQFVEQVESILSAVPETNDVLIVETKLDKRSSYYKYLKKHTELVEYSDLDSGQLVGWLCGQAKQRGATLSTSDARFLIDRVGAHQQLLASELEKLITYNPEVTKKTIELLCDKSPHSTIFDLLEAAFSKNVDKALRLYQEQRQLKVEPQQIVAMLAWQLNILAIIKTAQAKSPAQIASDAKLNPYVVGRSNSLLKTIPYLSLIGYINGLFDLDIKSKSTSINVDDALQSYIIELSQ